MALPTFALLLNMIGFMMRQGPAQPLYTSTTATPPCTSGWRGEKVEGQGYWDVRRGARGGIVIWGGWFKRARMI